ncbi:MAG: phosphoenolpyruvate carboxykinase domain-containing protein [Ruminococcus callidus]
MAEHMLILGVQKPDGETKYITAAFPSACGKTNLAMLIPPEGYKKNGYKVFTVGDDIAWMKPGKDGRLYAINPENGFFGVAPGTNDHSNPNALACTKSGTIFTNVALNNADNTVWWEKLDKNPPVDATEWTGKKVNGRNSSLKAVSWLTRTPDSPLRQRTARASPEFNNPEGVPISAIIFGGRRASTTPLVYQSFDWTHGTYMGSAVSSETTAAATGAVGVLRHDPMAMKPFIGYNVGDYWAHWLEMGEKLGDKAPKIFNVNWFKTDDEGNFLWPGFGDNMRVLDWIIKRCEGTVDAVETPIGYEPKAEDINVDGLVYEGKQFTSDDIADLLKLDMDKWESEITEMRRYYDEDIKAKGGNIPAALYEQLDKLEDRIKKAAK